MLTLERLREVLEYDPESGLWVWKLRMGSQAAKGQVAGSLHYTYGYIEIRVDGRSYRSHRLAWLFMTGEWPKQEIDHINCCAADNRWVNLREATRSQNNANRKTYAKSGFKGVAKHPSGKWCAFISGKYIGIYDTPEQAHAAYCVVAEQRFGNFARFE